MALREQLQDALGSAYTIQRELGGGGMSRVFVARDEALGRDVVVKVLPPDLLAGVSADRFDREVRLAARLQHAHIVPVLSAGQMDGVPYYTMPFVDGASLRDRVTGEGELPITEAVSILRDVARALAYAHERGVVHRDIKPDNVLLSGGAAVVTDFGIAKAISAARTGAQGETLTQMGVSIGTPAYMAPEQAAADPATDHRADIYAFGCLAYEVLAGRPPFTAKSPQRLLAAQMSETPEPIEALRPETPPTLARLVMDCLAKDPEHRPQRATELLQALDAASSSASASMPALLAGGRPMLLRALAVYALAFVLVAAIARAAISAIGLPDWVFPGALIVMALGLPIVLFTAYVHRVARTLAVAPAAHARATRRSSRTMNELAVRARPHWSWRRTALGGGIALGGFVLLVVAYMALRALGIGPAGSLLAAGTIGEHDRLLVADLQGPASDSTLGSVVTDALRTALGQSRSVQTLQPNAVQDVLRRMQRPVNTHVDISLAKEIAEREGISAIVDGRVIEVGGRYVLSLRLASRTGEDLATFRETADDEKDLLPAIDRVAKQVRARIGESLRAVQHTPPLEQVTTPSLEALRKYVQGSRVLIEQAGLERGTRLIEEAIALDTGFAMAYRRLAIEYGNRRLRERADQYYQKAFSHQERLTEPERHLLLGSYYQNSRQADRAKAREAYERLLAIQPNNVGALNNLAIISREAQDYRGADTLTARALRVTRTLPPLYQNRAMAQVDLRLIDSARATIDSYVARFPNDARALQFRASLLWTERKYDSVAITLAQLEPHAKEATDRASARVFRASLARLHGRLRDARRLSYEGHSAAQAAGDRLALFRAGLDEANESALLLGDRDGALRMIDSLLRRHRLDTVTSFVRREYMSLVTAYAFAGEPERARKAMLEWDARRSSFRQPLDTVALEVMAGFVDLASGRHREAARKFRHADSQGCAKCDAPVEGRAWELSEEPDSAIAAYERFVDTPAMLRSEYESYFLPTVHQRLGELYEARNNRERALRNYRAFIELWKDADPELQPAVTNARQRVAALTRGTDRPR
ncbi:MAG TPA: protein kinase [Gemmatimonadaceae bacterium]|nr:protein kinase [Gemmatimonadaceae bacterium]